MRLDFFLLILVLHLQKIIGHVGFDSSASCGYPLFIVSMAKCLFLFLPFCFCVYHSPYYILIIWAYFLFFTISFITTLCWRRFFVFVPLVLFDLRVRLDIQPQRKNCWLLDMEAGFKIPGFNFFLFLLPLIFSLSVNWGCFRFFGSSVFFFSFGLLPS